jgi:glycosyltransferase involved in cell wall biosynthesis
MRSRLSVIVITRDEERDIADCLESVRGVADETVVVDNFSTDRTREIAARLGARVVEHEFEGFGPQKQFALEQAAGDWVLNIDADERVTEDLAREIRALLERPLEGLPAGFEIPFQLVFMGRRLRFGGCFGERHTRLFRREKARYTGAAVHEGIRVDGPLGSLAHPVRHLSYRNFAEYLEKCRRYTGLIAARKFAEGRRFSAWQHLRLPWEFFVRYVAKGGFLDGAPGFTYAALSAYYAWLKHVRLVDHERGVADGPDR